MHPLSLRADVQHLQAVHQPRGAARLPAGAALARQAAVLQVRHVRDLPAQQEDDQEGRDHPVQLRVHQEAERAGAAVDAGAEAADVVPTSAASSSAFGLLGGLVLLLAEHPGMNHHPNQCRECAE